MGVEGPFGPKGEKGDFGDRGSEGDKGERGDMGWNTNCFIFSKKKNLKTWAKTIFHWQSDSMTWSGGFEDIFIVNAKQNFLEGFDKKYVYKCIIFHAIGFFFGRSNDWQKVQFTTALLKQRHGYLYRNNGVN